jgi:hypothetical protein
MTEAVTRSVLASIAISTSLGVFMHDSQLDKATTSAIVRAESTESQAKAGSPDPHVHAERPRMSKKAGSRMPDPRDKTKNREQKKVAPKLTKTGGSMYFLPI